MFGRNENKKAVKLFEKRFAELDFFSVFHKQLYRRLYANL